MSDRVRDWRIAIFSLAATAAWCSSAAAGPLQCQARATYLFAPVPVDVSFQAFVAGGAPPLFFFWDFGDGSTSSEQNPTHTYTEAGVFQAVLTMSDMSAIALACKDTALVTPGVAVDPTCLISAEPRWSESADPIHFYASPAFTPGPPPYTWTWTFGDGAKGTGDSPLHAYAAPGTYWAAVTVHSADGYARECGTIRVTTLLPQVLAVGEPRSGGGLRLDPPRPNPFVIATTLAFTLPRPGRVRLLIMDASGRRVATLVDEVRAAGPQVAVWQGRAEAGQLVPAGLYFAVLEHEGRTQTVRIARVR